MGDFADATDRRMFISIGPSGGPPAYFMIDRDTWDPIDAWEPRLLTLARRWLVHKVIFRSGWTLHVDAPDVNPVRIRCRDRAAAETLARRIVTSSGAGATAPEVDPVR